MNEEKVIFGYTERYGGISGLCRPPITDIKILDQDFNNLLLIKDNNQSITTLPYKVIQDVLKAINENEEIFSFDPLEIEREVDANINSQGFGILDSNGNILYFSNKEKSFKLISDIDSINYSPTYKLEKIISLAETITGMLNKNQVDVNSYLPSRFTIKLT